MIFVNGVRLRQVLSAQALENGTFYVDEAANKVSIKVQANLTYSTVEVAVRDQLAFFYNVPHITMKGMMFQHAADKFSSASVTFFNPGENRNCKDIVLENNAFVSNNQTGLIIFCNDMI
jgi:hypothetical protein